MHRADAGAGEHGNRRLGDHRHVDEDAVARLDSLRFQRVGKTAGLGEEVGIGEVAGVARLPDPVDRDLVALSGSDVPVEAILRGVDPAADEPFRERSPGPVEDLIPGFLPGKGRGPLAPPAFGVLEGAAVQGLVFLHGTDVGLGGERGGRGEDPVFLLERFDVLAHGL